MRAESPSLCLACLTLAACLDPDAPGNLVPLTVDEDPSLPAIEVADTRLHSETYGDPSDPMVIVLHGGPGSDYASTMPLRGLADDGYFVVFWDQRGAGLSRRHAFDDLSTDLYLEDLRLVVEHYSQQPDQPIVFIGRSWGGMYLTWFINEYADYGGRVRGAVLSEPGGFTARQVQDFYSEFFGSIGYGSELLNDAAWSTQFMTAEEHARADYLASMRFPGGHPKVGNDPENPAPATRSGAVVSAFFGEQTATSNFDWTTDLDAFGSRVLFLRGDRNQIADLEHQQKLAAFYPNAEIVTLAGAGHEMIWEKPDEYLDAVLSYFDEIGFEGGK